MKSVKTQGKRVLLLCIVGLLCFASYLGFIHGENALDITGLFQEEVSIDKQSTLITLEVTSNSPDTKVLKITSPNGEVSDHNTVTYQALENKAYTFIVSYSIVNNENSTPVVEEKQETFQYEVNSLMPKGIDHQTTQIDQPVAPETTNREVAVASPEADFSFSSGKITSYNGVDTDVVIPDTINGTAVTTIGAGAFYKKTKIKSITIPSSVTTIENATSSTNGAFANCSALTTVTINGPISHIGDYAFYSSSIKTINNVTPITSVGKYAFNFCTYLAEVNLGTLTSIAAGSFSGCKYLTKPIKLDSSIVSIPDTAFSSCIRLLGIECAAPITSIGKKAFTDCEKITTINLGNLTSIPDSAFENCKLLSNITLPETLLTIGERAFYYCGFNMLKIPSSVTSIGTDAFSAQRAIGNYSFKTGKMLYTFPDEIDMTKVTPKGSNVVIDPVARTAHITDNFPMFSYNIQVGNATVTATMVVTVNVDPMTYKVIFKDYDGITILEELTVEDGDDAIISDVPTRTGFTFIGWDGITEEIYEDKIFVAQYKSLPVTSATNVTIKQGESFDPLMFITATDADGTALNDITITSATVDTTVVGIYTITYTVKDKWGGESNGSFQLTIKEKVIDKPDVDDPDNPDEGGGEKPTPPEDNVTPGEKDDHVTPNPDGNDVKTSDESKGMMYALLVLVSITCLLAMVLKNRLAQNKK